MSDDVKWKSVLNFSDDHVDDLRFTGYFYIKQGKYEIAKSLFEALVVIQAQEHPDDQNSYDYKTLGALYLELGKYVRALRYLEKTLQLDPEDWVVQLNKMYCLFSLKRIDEGLEYAYMLQQSPVARLSNSAEAFIIAWGGK